MAQHVGGRAALCLGATYPGLVHDHSADAFGPDSLGAVIQRTVVEGIEPVRQVFHTADNSWNVGDGVNGPNEPGAVVVTCISRLVDQDPSLAELVDLPPGFAAYRDGRDEPWLREPFTELV